VPNWKKSALVRPKLKLEAGKVVLSNNGVRLVKVARLSDDADHVSRYYFRHEPFPVPTLPPNDQHHSVDAN
jgi:hypothetical protein